MRIFYGAAVAVPFCVIVALSGVFASHAVAQPSALDHFKCYFTTDTPVNQVVSLEDQFDKAANITETARVLSPVRFCNPVRKIRASGKVTPIINQNNHLKLYLIATSDPPVTRTVIVKNQFGQRQKLTVFDAEVLAVPTKKGTLPAPSDLDHFKCYRATGSPRNIPVTLEDQFHTEQTRVREPFGLCNPVVKTVGTTVTPIVNPTAHLVCYKIVPTTFTTTVVTTNQFGNETLTVKQADLLCVPSEKLAVQ